MTAIRKGSRNSTWTNLFRRGTVMARLQTSQRNRQLRGRFRTTIPARLQLPPRLEALEDRLPPGDTVLGALVGRSLIGSTALALECTSAPANTAQGAQDSITTGSPISVPGAMPQFLGRKLPTRTRNSRNLQLAKSPSN